MTEQDLIIQKLRREVDELEEKNSKLEDEIKTYKAFEEFLKEKFDDNWDLVCKLFADEYKGGTEDGCSLP